MSAVDTRTGEIVARDPQEENAVAMLSQAITALTGAVDFMPIDEVVTHKAQVATIATATRELDMSKEAQDLATEAVRRAEWAIGRAIRKGQSDGTIVKQGQTVARPGHHAGVNGMVRSIHDFVGRDEWQGGGANPGIQALADVAPEEIDTAITEAKAEGNLSRANVVRKVRKQQGPTTREQRADLIVKLANEGYSSRQMPSKVGVTEETVRQIARDFDIDIPADRVVTRTRRINSTNVVVNTATALEGLVSGIELVDFAALDTTEVRQWATSLTDSTRKLARFAKQIQEMAQ